MKVLVLLALVGAVCAAALPAEAPAPVEKTDEVEPAKVEAPVPVADTEEVALAKAEFETTYAAVAEAAAAGEVPEVFYIEYTKEVADARAAFQAAFDAAVAGEGPVPSYIDYTKDVADARANFQAAYDAAAAAAAAAVVAEEIVPEDAPVAVEETEEVTDAKAGVFAIDGKLSPFYTNALAYSAFGIHSPMFARAPVITNVKVDTEPLTAESPLTYSSLGLPGPFGFFGYPIVKVADAEE